MFPSHISSKVVGALSLGSFLSPLLVFAQGGTVIRTSDDVLQIIRDFVTQATPIIIGLAVFVIIYGVFRYIVQADNEEARKSGKKFIFWGVIGVFVMISIWGLVNIVLNILPTDPTPPESPELFPQ
jgi:dipeptide/tripeptide permease